MENYNNELESKLIEMVKEKERKDKQMLTLEWVIGILSTIIILVPVLVAPFLDMAEWKQALVALAGFIPGLIGIFFALKIEQVAGYYECKACGHKYVPTFTSVLWAMHMGRTRYLKCPECHKKTWQKKVISKD